MIQGRKRRFKILLVILLILGSVCCFAPQVIFVVPYRNFQKKEMESAPQFDALNEAILAEVKPPNNAAVIYRDTIGITDPVTTHGRKLYIEYDLGDLTTGQILSHYHHQLTRDGWTLKGEAPFGASYYREAACIGVGVQANDEYKEKYFSVGIWHDFYSQKFSPPVPSWFGWEDGDETISFYELLEMGGKVLRCPGK